MIYWYELIIWLCKILSFQEEKIIKLEEKVDTKLQPDRYLPPAAFINDRVKSSQDGHSRRIIDSVKLDSDKSYGALNEIDDSIDNNSKMNLINEPQIANRPTGDSSTRAIAPSSCRELSLIGHSLDGLYLVQNVDTRKIETVLCNFGPSRKFTL